MLLDGPFPTRANRLRLARNIRRSRSSLQALALHDVLALSYLAGLAGGLLATAGMAAPGLVLRAWLLLGVVDDLDPAALARIEMPTLVVCGDKDRDNGSPQNLVDALPNGRFAQVPGTHMSSVTESALGEAIARFLAG